MAEQVNSAAVRITRITELDLIKAEDIRTSKVIPWGLVEINKKLYRYDMNDYVRESIRLNQDVAKMLDTVEKLEKLVNTYLKDIDENREIT